MTCSLLYASDVYDRERDKKIIVKVIASALVKMRATQFKTFGSELSEEHPYLVMERDIWYFKDIKWPFTQLKSSRKLPKTNCHKLILIADLRSGADGRVWKACSESGYCCVLKFGKHGEEALGEELANIHKHGQKGRMERFGGADCILMPFYPSITQDQYQKAEVQHEIIKFIQQKYEATNLVHTDLKREHVRLVSPSAPPVAENMRLIDLRSMEKGALNLADVFDKLSFQR